MSSLDELVFRKIIEVQFGKFNEKIGQKWLFYISDISKLKTNPGFFLNERYIRRTRKKCESRLKILEK